MSMDVNVRDFVMVRDHYGWRNAEVVKVGRKWFYVKGYPDSQFSLENGRSHGGYGYPYAITIAAYEARERREHMEHEITEAGVAHYRRGGGSLPEDQLVRVHAAVMGDMHTEYHLVRVGKHRNDNGPAHRTVMARSADLDWLMGYAADTAPFEPGEPQTWWIETVRVIQYLADAEIIPAEQISQWQEARDARRDVG